MTKHAVRQSRRLPILGEGMSVWDYVLFALLAAGCFLCFQQTDILHTGASANAYLGGHILDFYEYNRQVLGGDGYYPSTYIAFAIWNIPLKLIGQAYETMSVPLPVMFWYKLMPCLLYLWSAFILYQIAKDMGMGADKSKMCAYAFLTAPIAFFSQFIFGQYDILTVFFMLLGLKYCVRGDMRRFVLFFAIAVTFKYFALLFFVPLLLLKEKKYLKIILALICVAIPFALETGLYITSLAFRQDVLGFSATNYVLAAGFDIHAHIDLSLVVMLFIAMCGWAYFTEPRDADEENKWAMFFLNSVIFLSFGLSMWHPQWLLMAMPFLVLSTFAHKRPDAFLVLDMALMLLYVMFCVNVWPNHVDQSLMRYGILGGLVGEKVQYAFPMRRLFVFKNVTVLYSCIAAILFVHAAFKHPSFMLTDISQSVRKFWNLIRARFAVGIAIFLIPALMGFVASFMLPTPFMTVPFEEHSEVNTGAMVAGHRVSQTFEAQKDNITQIAVYLKTLGNEVNTTMDVTLTDLETGETIMTHKVLTSKAFDSSYVVFKIPQTPLTVGKNYQVTFESLDAEEHNCIYLFGNQGAAATETRYALINGEAMPYQLCVDLYAK